MVRKLAKLILVAIMLFMVPKPGMAGGSASVDVMSNYVWRGQNLVNDGVVIQPAVGLEKDNIAIGFWANYSTDSGENTETDLTVSYSGSADKLSYEIGYIHYALINSVDTQEIYLSLAYDTILSPSVTIYYDFDEGDGAFVVVGAGHSMDVSGYTVNCGASVGINFDDEVMGYDDKGDTFTGLYYGELNLSMDIPWGEITVSPKLAYSFALGDGEDAIRAVNENTYMATSSGTETDVLYGGVGFSMEF